MTDHLPVLIIILFTFPKAVYQKVEVAPGFGRSFGQQEPAEPKVTTVKQTLTWHALDSENMNVKLFRFAEKWGQQVYGVLFWAVTIIDCDEDIENVRLAVGSNSGSVALWRPSYGEGRCYVSPSYLEEGS